MVRLSGRCHLSRSREVVSSLVSPLRGSKHNVIQPARTLPKERRPDHDLSYFHSGGTLVFNLHLTAHLPPDFRDKHCKPIHRSVVLVAALWRPSAPMATL